MYSLFLHAGGQNAAADSIYALLKVENNEEQLAMLQLEYAYATKYENIAKSIKSTEGALFILSENNNTDGIARANSYLGVYMYLTDSIPQSIQYYKAAEQLYKKLDNSNRLARVYNNLGISYSQIYDNKTALEYYKKSLALKEKDPVNNEITSSLINISSLLYDQGDYEECIKTNEKALINSLQNNDLATIAVVYANLGAAHERLSHFQKSINYALKALSLYQNEVVNETAEIRTYSNLGSTYLSQNMLDEARYYFGLALELTANTQKVSMQAVASNNMAELERVSKNYDKARKYSLSALELVNKINNVEEKMVTLNELHLIEENVGNFKLALAYYKEYINISDSVMEASKNFETQQALAQSKVYLKQIQDKKELLRKQVISKKVNSMNWVLWLLLLLMVVYILSFLGLFSLNFWAQTILNFLIPFLVASFITMYVYLKTTIPKTADPFTLFLILISVVVLSTGIHVGLRSFWAKK